MARPNKDRTKTTVHLSQEDRDNCEAVRQAWKLNTASSAIRKALEIAAAPPELPLDTKLVLDVLRWATNLQFMSPKEKRELHDFSRQLYELQAAQKQVAESGSRTRGPEPGTAIGSKTGG